MAYNPILFYWRYTKMSRVSMLEERINGREVMAYVQGKYSYHSTSKLTRTIKALGLDPEGEDKTWAVVVGGRAGAAWSTGYKMAIVRL